MSANDNVNSNRGLSRPAAKPKPAADPKPAPLPAALSEIRELLRKVESQMIVWPEALSERVELALRTAQQENAELQKTEGREALNAWTEKTSEGYRVLNQLIKNLDGVATRQENHQKTLIWGISRELMKGVLIGALFTAIAAIYGGTIWLQVGPASQLGAALRETETTLSTYRQLWDTATTAEQKTIRQRLENKTAGK